MPKKRISFSDNFFDTKKVNAKHEKKRKNIIPVSYLSKTYPLKKYSESSNEKQNILFNPTAKFS